MFGVRYEDDLIHEASPEAFLSRFGNLLFDVLATVLLFSSWSS